MDTGKATGSKGLKKRKSHGEETPALRVERRIRRMPALSWSLVDECTCALVLPFCVTGVVPRTIQHCSCAWVTGDMQVRT